MRVSLVLSRTSLICTCVCGVCVSFRTLMRTSSRGLSGIISAASLARRARNDLCIRLIEKFEDFDGKSYQAMIIIAPEHSKQGGRGE